MTAAGLAQSSSCFHSLLAAYSEKHRHYHAVSHIDAMLGNLDAAGELAANPCEIEIAIWFHDAIYKPFSKTNEHDSADWAQDFLSKAGYNGKGIETIHGLIMATLHGSKLVTADEELIVDIDLCILGAEEEIYDRFEVNIRKEYRLVPKPLYKKKRKEILNMFLTRDRIYNTEQFYDLYENSARANLSRTIATL